ncbi:MAG: YdcF family protein [Rickettsiales bacterium]|nr:YdcF family protein [Rickettsiales bacterium]
MVEVLEIHGGGFRPKEPFLSEERSRKIMLVLLVVAAAYMVGFVVFALGLGTKDKRPGERTDAIIVLTGETRRITEAVRELARGSSDRLFISGVHRPAPVERVVERTIEDMRREKVLRGSRESLLAKIHKGKAENTIENGMESSRWARDNDIRSVRLMTSYYHMPRSLMIFRRYMPGTEIIPHPVMSESGGSAFSPARLRLAFSEYNKYVLTFLWNQLGLEDSFLLRLQGNV